MAVANPKTNPADSDPLDALPADELAACARLLALSVAHHRTRFGVVPLATTRAEISQSPPPATLLALRSAADKTLTESITLVRRDLTAQQQPPNQAELGATCEELRRQMRISVSAAVKMADLAGTWQQPATLRNISWGGAAIQSAALTANVGDRLCLLLPAAGKGPIRIEATVLRKALAAEQHEYGLRFDSLDPDDDERLLEVLKLLMRSPDPDNRRSEVRLVQRLEVEYGDAGEFGAVLEDISSRGMMLTVPDPLEIGESLLVSLSSVDTPFALNLRGRIVHRTLVEDCEFDMYRVGLEFEHPSPRLHDRISAVLHELALVRLRDGEGDALLEEIDVKTI